MSKTTGKTHGIPLFVFLAGFIVVLALIGISFDYWTSRGKVAEEDAGRRITVITTLFPYYDMARSIAGEDADVRLLLPPGISPHHFEPAPGDIRLLNESDVFIRTGSLLEPWSDDLLKGIDNPDVKIVNASEHALIEFTVGRDHPGVADEREHGTEDPHVWLDFDNAVSILWAVYDALADANHASADAYRERALVYESELRRVDEAYRDTVGLCRTRTFVQGGHRSFGYLAHRYGLEYFSTTGVSDEEEPTAGDIAGLVTLVREKALPYVFYEVYESPRTAEQIANETGADILTLNPAANVTKQEMEEGVTFISIMEQNLRHLSLALECQ
jgi:zinc transport system substrate-binding protein